MWKMSEIKNEIKIVIWDLDNTFWKGTLSEGEICIIPENLELVKKLTDRGIINSIVSKNDYNYTMEVMKKEIGELVDYFILPSIDWTPKGIRVKKLLNEIGILPQNALMIDDNPHNLEEVRYYNSEINCILPINLSKLEELSYFNGKDDRSHSRLKQYKVLERKVRERKNYTSNYEFLKKSNIKIDIRHDVLSYEQRIYELVHRTNQLNYTKKRSSREELHRVLTDEETESAYVVVEDSYGNYGVCGFYAIKDGKMIHFLFSCRILGMGIEQYIYAKLGYPIIDVFGEVAYKLSTNISDIPTWINEAELKIYNIDSDHKKIKLLFVGGCDLEQTSVYMEDKDLDITYEFNKVIDGIDYRSSDSSQLLNSVRLSDEKKMELCKFLPFYDNSVTFATTMFKKNYDIIVYSVVDDYIRGMYRSKYNSELYVGFAGYFDQEKWINKYPKEEFLWLFDNFEFVGKESLYIFEKNLKDIADMLKDTLLIIINGTDIDVPDLVGRDRVQRNFEMNKVVDKLIAEKENMKLIDMRNIVKCRDDILNDNRHFTRKVYYKMSEEIKRIIYEFKNEKEGNVF